ncbi:MAG: YqgE/AlgH family protein [Gammaproteobacteria bacterium]|nr:YqgE/AlgH family protein [Gammaproteobacteria bacterium]MDH3559725.1 YqgE/AlgH family protein [Gammaproteobacteria bacterium]
MDTFDSLNNHFLIAMPALSDPNFHHTATYICEHNDEGALGLIINRPTDLRLGEILAHMGIEATTDEIAAQPVYLGGPVQNDRGFVLHQPVGNWEATLKVTQDTAITSSRDILDAIARGEGPEKIFITLGYAGWGAGQLEHELAENAWLSGPADSRIVFDTPYEQRWEAAAGLIGVDLKLLSGEAGHA